MSRIHLIRARQRRMHYSRILASALASFTCLAFPAEVFAQSADLQAQPGHFALKTSGFENIDLADATGYAGGGNSESEIEIGPQYRTQSGVVFAARGVLNLQAETSLGGSGSAWAFTEPELSGFVIGPFGRIEVGDRAGFPQSLVGFTPSEIAFTAAEFGPDSGTRLDPNGHLPTAFLPHALGDRINGLTYLGYAERFYDDRSPKLIYVSPRSSSGFYGAVSYTPRTNTDGGGYLLTGGARIPLSQLDDVASAGAFRNVVQAAVVWDHRTEWLDLSTGATFSDATTAPDRSFPTTLDAAAGLRRSDSLSAGITATFYDTWTFGLSGGYDGFSQQQTAPGTSRGTSSPYGVVTSLNYVNGPWVIGGYYQHAVGNNVVDQQQEAADLPLANGAPAVRSDKVDVGEFGLSYLLDKDHDLLGAGYYTDVKLYANVYLYNFRGPGGLDADQTQSGAVFITGARFSFF